MVREEKSDDEIGGGIVGIRDEKVFRTVLSLVLILVGTFVFFLVLLNTSQANAQQGGTTGGTTGDDGNGDDGNGDDGNGDDGDDECPGATEVVALGPSTESDDATFSVTGDRFRVSYDVTIIDEDNFGFVDIDIEDGSGDFVEGESVSETGEGDFIVLEGPGAFNLDVVVDPDDSAEYTVVVDDCTDDSGDDGGDDNGDDDDDDDNNDDDNGDDSDDDGDDDDDVIDDSVPDKDLPNTGGSAVGGLVFAGLFLAFSSVLILHRLKRN